MISRERDNKAGINSSTCDVAFFNEMIQVEWYPNSGPDQLGYAIFVEF